MEGGIKEYRRGNGMIGKEVSREEDGEGREAKKNGSEVRG